MKILALLTFTLLLQSCGGVSGDKIVSDYDFDKKYYATEIKLISSSIKDPKDKRSMTQNTYTLNSSSRLLTRLTQVSSKAANALVNNDKRMYLVIAASAFEHSREMFEKDFEVCPITTNWMMLATWDKAHNLPTSSNKWQNKGGDFEAADCVKADSSKPETEVDMLYFDVSDWYLHYVQSKGKNYGLMLKTSIPVTIYGDENSKKGPHFIWKEN